jgi:hypothetical protein
MSQHPEEISKKSSGKSKSSDVDTIKSGKGNTNEVEKKSGKSTPERK